MKVITLFTITLLAATSLFAQKADLPSDKNATKETANLYRNLKKLRSKGFLVGHQDDLAYGVNWKYTEGRSDVKDVTGDYPGIYGWDLSHLELGDQLNIDSVPFSYIKRYIEEGYKQGAVITISWHATNPLTGKSAWDPTPGTVASILPGGDKHQLYNAWLDKIAVFFTDLKGDKGEPVPILFRPFHELSGDYFWWGTSACNGFEYQQLFQYTVSYLRDVKKVHNLLYVYNTGSNFDSEKSYLERYPGDDDVDVLSYDDYASSTPSAAQEFIKKTQKHFAVLEKVATDKNKISAFGETGCNQIPDAHWWTKSLLKALNGHSPAYVLLWRNAGYKYIDKSTEFYVPYPGSQSAQDFINFFNSPQTLFAKDALRANLYQ